jgi:hypothetical protein
MIYLLTAIGLSSGGSTHLHTNSTQNNTNNNRATQIQTNVEECGPCHVFASFYPGICLTTEEKHVIINKKFMSNLIIWKSVIENIVLIFLKKFRDLN